MLILGPWSRVWAAVAAVRTNRAGYRPARTSSSRMTPESSPATSPRGDARNDGSAAAVASNGCSVAEPPRRAVAVGQLDPRLVRTDHHHADDRRCAARCDAHLPRPDAGASAHRASTTRPRRADGGAGHGRRPRPGRRTGRADRHDHRSCAATRVAGGNAERVRVRRRPDTPRAGSDRQRADDLPDRKPGPAGRVERTRGQHECAPCGSWSTRIRRSRRRSRRAR